MLQDQASDERSQDQWSSGKYVVFEDLKNTYLQKRIDTIDITLKLVNFSIGTTDNVNFLVTMKAEFPGLPIQYSSDNGASWKDYTEPFYLTDQKPLMMRTLYVQFTSCSLPCAH